MFIDFSYVHYLILIAMKNIVVIKKIGTLMHLISVEGAYDTIR